MRYGYALLDKNEDAWESSKLFFMKILDTDWIFIDRGSGRYAMKVMLQKVHKNDQIVLQSRSDCGLSAREIHDLEQILFQKKARLSFTVSEPESCLEESAEIMTARKYHKHLDHKLFADLYQQYKIKQITKGEMARQLGITYPTLQSRLLQYENGLIAG